MRAQFAERNDCFTKEKLEADRRLGAVEAETQRLNEVLKESSEKHAEELKKQEERVSICKLHHVASSTTYEQNLTELMFEFSSCVVAVYYKDTKSRQAYQQLEKEVSEGVGAEQRKTAAD